MGTYIYSILCASLAVALIYSACPDGEGLSKFISFAGALAVALTILHPFLSDDPLSFEDMTEHSVSESVNYPSRAEYAARNAVLSLSALSGADAENITAQVTVGEGGDISVVLICEDYIAADREGLEGRLAEILGFNVDIRDRRDGTSK